VSTYRDIQGHIAWYNHKDNESLRLLRRDSNRMPQNTMHNPRDDDIADVSKGGFGRHTAHHQDPKTALAASGFSYVEGCFYV